MKPLVIRSAIVSSVGGLIFGFDTAVISGANDAIKYNFHLSSFMLGFVVATALIGTIVGAATAGRPADVYGRKKMLFLIGILYVVGALGSCLSHNEYLFMIFRFIGGLGVGASSVVAPIYTAEVAPPKNRGRLVGLVQFNIVLGILLAYASNAVIRAILDPGPTDNYAWRWMLGIMVVPAAIFLALLFTVPETPRWLMSVGREEEAKDISLKLTETPQESDQQMQEIRDTLAADAAAEKVPFFTHQHRKVIMLAVAIAFFNQMSGINAILYYAPNVMKLAGAGENAAYTMSIAVGVMNLIATMSALTVIDRIGRRTLMIVGSIGYLLSLGFLAGMMFFYESHKIDGKIPYHSAPTVILLGLLLFIAAHAFGQGSVIWVFISEIFPNRIRARGQSTGALTHWTFAAITSWAFPPIVDALGGGVAFSVFFVAMIGQLIWVLRVMPETKGIPLEEMEARLGLVEPVESSMGRNT